MQPECNHQQFALSSQRMHSSIQQIQQLRLQHVLPQGSKTYFILAAL
jgi:hypothetical protein